MLIQLYINKEQKIIIDSHCHAWEYWPYQERNSHEPNQLPVPNPEIWGNVEQLIYEMDNNNINQATIVSAQIWHNPENNKYISRCVEKYSNRLYQFADFDSNWSDSYHKEGAAERLEELNQNLNIIGFTHYLDDDDDGDWLYSEEGIKLFQVANKNKMIASIAGSPKHQKSIRKVAELFPDLPILCHHMSGMNNSNTTMVNINEVLDSSEYKNIFLKLSGYNYVIGSQRRWDFPYNDAMWIYKEAYQAFGSQMVWGSDFPVVKFSSTYKQVLEVFNKYCDFIPEDDKKLILGKNLEKILSERGKYD